MVLAFVFKGINPIDLTYKWIYCVSSQSLIYSWFDLRHSFYVTDHAYLMKMDSYKHIVQTFVKRPQNVPQPYSECSINVSSSFSKRSLYILKTFSGRFLNVLRTQYKLRVTLEKTHSRTNQTETLPERPQNVFSTF